MMDRSEVVAGIAGELNETEQALDKAIAHATGMVQALIAGRAELNLSPVVAAESQARAMEALAALGVARNAVVACHDELAKDHRRLGWGAYAIGFMDKVPEGDTRPPPRGQLRAV